MVKRKNPSSLSAPKNPAGAVPEMSLREHAQLVAQEFLADLQLRFESQLDALLERVGLVRKSQV